MKPYRIIVTLNVKPARVIIVRVPELPERDRAYWAKPTSLRRLVEFVSVSESAGHCAVHAREWGWSAWSNLKRDAANG